MSDTVHGGGATDLRAGRLRLLWRSTIGKKWVVAITGAMMVAYVTAHMVGNLEAVRGPGGGRAAIDSYAQWLRTIGRPVLPYEGAVWIIRVILLTALALHITAIVQLTRRNQAARPAGHAAQRRRGSLSARTMVASGALLLAFIVFHILHFTAGVIHPAAIRESHVYANVYDAFHIWWVVAIYLGAVALLGLHLRHGLWSAAQTSGLDNPDRNWTLRRFAVITSAVILIGFATVPILMAAGALERPLPAPHPEISIIR